MNYYFLTWSKLAEWTIIFLTYSKLVNPYKFFFVNHIRKKKNVDQSTKERKAKQNLLDIKFDERIRGRICLALKVPFITYYDLLFITYYESKGDCKPVKTNSACNGNYIEYKSNGDLKQKFIIKRITSYDKTIFQRYNKQSSKMENSANNANQFYFF